MKYYLTKSKFVKKLTLGICFSVLSSNVVLANGFSQPSILSSILPVGEVQVGEPIDVNILPAYESDKPISKDNLLEPKENYSKMLQKQKEIDEYLFEDHVEEINQLDFTVTHTGPFEDYVEIAITPYSEENAEYLYRLFGKEDVKVVEGQQGITYPLEIDKTDPNVIGGEVETDIQLISADDDVPEPEYENQLIRKDNDIRVQVNGEFLQLDAEPFIENDRILFPLRGVMEKLGARVKWDSKKGMVEVTAGNTTIQLTIGEDTAKVTKEIEGQLKEEKVNLEVPAKIEKNRTFIPGRFVSEALGAIVRWDNSIKAMVIETKDEDISDDIIVKNLVISFGENLRMVSLLAPEEIIIKSMNENYSEFVSPELLEEWKIEPQKAPGRLTSSPWPERIEIISINKVIDDEYEVKGEIIEVTGTQLTNYEIVAKQPIIFSIKKVNNNWLITDVIKDINEESSSVVYNNSEYGFDFHLPQNWENYTLIEDEWEGTYVDDSKDNEVGPKIIIRHPKWETEHKRQDIPLLIFTIEQWNLIEEREFNVGAAPIGPKELGRNDKYVFALPARYNYEFLEGYEEVESILENNSLQPTNS